MKVFGLYFCIGRAGISGEIKGWVRGCNVDASRPDAQFFRPFFWWLRKNLPLQG